MLSVTVTVYTVCRYESWLLRPPLASFLWLKFFPKGLSGIPSFAAQLKLLLNSLKLVYIEKEVCLVFELPLDVRLQKSN